MRPAGVRVDLHALSQLDLMDDGQWQSDGPVRRAGLTDPDLLNDSESSRSPDENQNRLVEEAEEVEQGPRGGQKPLRQDHTNNNSDDEDYDSSRVEDEEEEEEEEEEGDSNSGAFSPELDGHIRDSPTPSPSPTGNRHCQTETIHRTQFEKQKKPGVCFLYNNETRSLHRMIHRACVWFSS